MRYVPTVDEPDALRAAFKEAYGDCEAFRSDPLVFLEFGLLSDAHEEMFGERAFLLMTSYTPVEEVNAAIRRALETGVPYEPVEDIPEGHLA